MSTEETIIEKLWEEVRELGLGSRTTQIDQLFSPPKPLQFLRDYVSQNKPCLISNAINHWPALHLWQSTPYLLNTLSTSPPVSLHLTPTGRADSLTQYPEPSSSSSSLCFASAHVEKLPFDTALHNVISSDAESRFVAYLQQQNDCFRGEYAALANDCDDHVEWASEALGCLPEAVNLWIGNELSETSFHKDHYENIYAVVCGEKHFLLLPPTDVHRMYIRDYPAAQYRYSQDNREFTLELEEPMRYVPWCSVNPFPPPNEKEKEVERFPFYFNGPKPYEVTVKAGEILYLPSMWFHHVRQSPDSRGLTIAVNYWYDMRFDIKYAYFNFLQSIHYQSVNKLKSEKLACKVSCFNISSQSEDESDITAAIANGNMIEEHSDKDVE